MKKLVIDIETVGFPWEELDPYVREYLIKGLSDGDAEETERQAGVIAHRGAGGQAAGTDECRCRGVRRRQLQHRTLPGLPRCSLIKRAYFARAGTSLPEARLPLFSRLLDPEPGDVERR